MNISEKTKEILRELCGEESILEEHSLQNDLTLDSLSMVQLLVEIEEVFSIELDETDMNPFELNTVRDVVDLISKYCGDNDEK